MVFPPESPHPRRRTVSVSASPPLQPSNEAVKTVPANASPSHVPVLPLPAQPSHALATSAPCPASSYSSRLAPQPLFQWEASGADYHELSVVGTPPSEDPRHSSPQTWTPSTKTVVSVGCQTEDEAFLPRMQAGFSFLLSFLFNFKHSVVQSLHCCQLGSSVNTMFR